MRYVAAYLLATIGNSASPSASDLTKILDSVGVEVDAAQMDLVINNLKGKNLEELMAAGMEKLSSMPAGGAAPAAGGAAATAGGAEEKKEEAKKEESEEESDDDMGFGLFD